MDLFHLALLSYPHHLASSVESVLFPLTVNQGTDGAAARHTVSKAEDA